LTYYPTLGYGSLDFLFLFDQCKKKEPTAAAALPAAGKCGKDVCGVYFS